MSDNGFRIGSSEENRASRKLENKSTPAHVWTNSIREKMLKAVADLNQDFEGVWDSIILECPLPKEVYDLGITEEETKVHLKYIWTEIQRQINDRN